MLDHYTPRDWYWAAADGRIYASARNAIVSADDAALAAWEEAGGTPTRWPVDEAGAQTDAALQDVLAPYGITLPEPAPNSERLVAYANARQWALAIGGYTVTIKGQAINFATDEDSLGALDRKAMRLAQPTPPATVNWQTGPTSFAAIGADDFAHAATLVDDFVQATFDALPAIFAAIAAGKVTTFAQIDAAAWPAPSGAVP